MELKVQKWFDFCLFVTGKTTTVQYLYGFDSCNDDDDDGDDGGGGDDDDDDDDDDGYDGGCGQTTTVRYLYGWWSPQKPQSRQSLDTKQQHSKNCTFPFFFHGLRNIMHYQALLKVKRGIEDLIIGNIFSL